MLELFLGALAFGDVRADPDGAVLGVSGVEGVSFEVAPEKGAVALFHLDFEDGLLALGEEGIGLGGDHVEGGVVGVEEAGGDSLEAFEGEAEELGHAGVGPYLDAVADESDADGGVVEDDGLHAADGAEMVFGALAFGDVDEGDDDAAGILALGEFGEGVDDGPDPVLSRGPVDADHEILEGLAGGKDAADGIFLGGHGRSVLAEKGPGGVEGGLAVELVGGQAEDLGGVFVGEEDAGVGGMDDDARMQVAEKEGQQILGLQKVRHFGGVPPGSGVAGARGEQPFPSPTLRRAGRLGKGKEGGRKKNRPARGGPPDGVGGGEGGAILRQGRRRSWRRLPCRRAWRRVRRAWRGRRRGSWP